MSSDRDDTPSLLEVGRITKPHGVRGDVLVQLLTDRSDRLAPGSVLHTDAAELVVSSSRPHHDRHIVRFEGVGDREAAEELRGVALLAEPAAGDDDTLWVHELIGCVVVEVDGTRRGVVESVVANPAADLLGLEDGHLVPVVFVVEGPRDGVIRVDCPDGLFDLGPGGGGQR